MERRSSHVLFLKSLLGLSCPAFLVMGGAILFRASWRMRRDRRWVCPQYWVLTTESMSDSFASGHLTNRRPILSRELSSSICSIWACSLKSNLFVSRFSGTHFEDDNLITFRNNVENSIVADSQPVCIWRTLQLLTA